MLLCSTITYSQETQDTVSLKELFHSLELKFGYTFNYLENAIEGITIPSPNDRLTFKETLNSIQEKTGLTFQYLENNFISVLKPNERIQICGFLKDIDTQKGLSFATIRGGGNSTITNDEGYFLLEVSSLSDVVTIRHLAYKTLTLQVTFFNTPSCPPIYLKQQLEALEEVVISNYLVEGINKLNTGALEINFSKFNILPGLIETDVLQAVQAFPGIQSINETVSNINIRGGTHDQNLILWDDIKMYQSGHFFGLISVFNPQMTSNVIVKKNGTSAEYSDGVSGSIIMQTEKSVNSDFKASLGANLIDVNGFADIPLGEKSSVQIAARKSLSDFTSTPTYEKYFERIAQDTEIENNQTSVINSDQQFNFYDTSLRWLYNLSEKDHIRVNFITINNELQFTENAIIDVKNTSRESTISQNSIGGGLFYSRKWNDTFKTSLQVYNTDYKLNAVNANLFESQRFLQENKVSETGVRIKSDYILNEIITVDFGYQVIESEVTNLDDVDNPLIRTLISEVVRTHSGFTQINFQSENKKTHLNLGFRYNYLDKFKKNLYEPRISFYQKFLKNFSVELSGEVKHQTISQTINFQNDFLGVEKRRWQLANNEDIPIIISKQSGITLNYTYKGLLCSAEAYYKNVDGITTQSQGFQNQYEFAKTNGSYDVIGIDVLFKKSFKNLNAWTSYSYMDNQYTFNTLPEVTFPSNFNITHSAAIGLTYRYKSLKLSTGLNWHTGNPTTRPVSGQEIIEEEINYNTSNTDRLRDYMRLDASAVYEFQLGKTAIHAGVSAWNILNRENEINNYYRINNEGEVEEFIQKALRFTPNASLRVFF